MLSGLGQRGAHVTDLCSMARAIKADGVYLPAVEGFASCGAYGEFRSNEERDLLKWLGNIFPHVAPYLLKVHLEIGDEPGITEEALVPVLIPYELAHGMKAQGDMQFTVSYAGADGDDGNLNFWRWALGKDFGRDHPVVSKCAASDDLLRKLLPWILHMDGAEIFNNTEYYIYSWSVFGAIGAVWDIKMILCLMPHKRMRCKLVKKNAFAIIGKFVSWCLKVWATGKFPDKGFYEEPLTGDRAKLAGKTICGGYRAAYVGSKHDRKARREIHNFQRHYSKTFCCDLCLATQAFKNAPMELLYSDYNDDAAWTKTCITHGAYMTHSEELSSLVCVEGFHLSMMFGDILHDIWLGTARDDVCSTITDMLEGGELPGANVVERMNKLWGGCKQFCKRGGLSKPRGGLSISQIGRENKSQFPELSSKYKGMHVKLLCRYLAHVTYKKDDGTSVHKAMRSSLFWGLLDMIFVFDEAWRDGRWKLSTNEISRAQYAGRTYLLSYQWLSIESLKNKTHNFKQRPKRHYVDHMIRDLSNGINPNAVNCEQDETFMGIVKRIGCKTHGATAMMRTLQRYLVGLAMRVKQRLRLGRFVVSRPV
jgi:hypothetical protein